MTTNRIPSVGRLHPLNNPRLFRMIINTWPPYFGAGIRVKEIAADWQRMRVVLRLHWWNCNYVRSHFGGSLFAMTDPFYMLMLIRNLGPHYVVWDLAANIRYVRPGYGEVSAEFSLDESRLAEIREKAASGEKVTEHFHVDIVDEKGERVASVQKSVYIRKKLQSERQVETAETGKSANDCTVSPGVTAFSWGRMEVEGFGVGKDWQLYPGGGRAWDWRESDTGHFTGIQPAAVQPLIESGCRVVILTTGYLGRLRVPRATRTLLEEHGIRVLVVRTGKGCKLYNQLVADGQAVGGLFHSTC